VSFRTIFLIISTIIIGGLIGGYLVSEGSVSHKEVHTRLKDLNFPFYVNNNCHAPSAPVVGILSIPAINLVAPVDQGDSQSVMAQAIGHNPNTVWPGELGTSELSAHDVAQFSFINNLKDGDKIYYWIPCQERFEFSVVKKEIIQAGSTVWGLNHPAILLETCWPSNALYFTNQRLLVYAQEVGVASVDNYPKLPQAQTFKALIPLSLASLGLSLEQNYAPMGFMYFQPSNDYQWIESANPLNAENTGLELYFGALDAIKYNRLDWWQVIAPGIPFPYQLAGKSIGSYVAKLNVYMTLQGNNLLKETFSTQVYFGSTFDNLAVTVSDQNGTLVITNFS
jgi:sortase A